MGVGDGRLGLGVVLGGDVEDATGSVAVGVKLRGQAASASGSRMRSASSPDVRKLRRRQRLLAGKWKLEDRDSSRK
jgi:hypothetical protein